MSKDHSFDIVSEVSMQEVDNAVTQAKKELEQRFDFKGTSSSIELNKTEKIITLHTQNEYKLKALVDILQNKCVKRSVSLRALDYQTVETGMVGGSVKQDIKIKSGIETEKAKEIVKAIKDLKMKVQAQIQSDQVRVQAPKIDDLQAVIQFLKTKDFGIDFQFINYR